MNLCRTAVCLVSAMIAIVSAKADSPRYDVYLLIGQSNMCGRGPLPATPYDLTNVQIWNGSAWVQAVEPFFHDTGTAGAGLAASFARKMADAEPGVLIGLIPAAVGNTKLARWEPGGDLYGRAVEWTRKALAHGGRVKGILWHQGEADADSEQEVATYAARLKTMVAALRKEFGDVPFVAGELGPFLDTLGDISEKKGGKRSCRLWKDVNAQLKKAVREVPNAALVSADGLADKGDHLHFSTEALRVLGHRYAEEMRRLSQAEPVELPPLFGDGVHDDTAAIQARLDAGSSCVYLPPPAKEYLVSTTLVVRSGTELRLPRTARVRLAHGSCVEMITNGDWEEGAHDIVVSGGIWDYDNAHQSPNPYVTRPPDAFPKTFTPGYDYGALMRFVNVTRLRLEGMTMRNPTAYNCHLCAVRFFTVDDITFEADNWRPYPINNDGINVTGGSHHGRISNLRGYCSDDMVAINANKSKLKPACAVGPIFDIDIDGLYSDYTHRGVRIYSIGERVERITVRNVHIRTYRNAVAITHFQPGRPRGKFDSIVIRDIFASTAYEPETICHDRVAWPLVWVENDCDVGHLVIENVCRTETGCAYMPTVGIDPKATVENLVIRDCRQVNETKDDLVFLVNRGKVANLELGSVSLKSAPGAGRSILRDDKGATGFEMGNRKWTPNVRPKGK